jgi:RNA polymerase sigma-70 factor (ECF subfamily)
MDSNSTFEQIVRDHQHSVFRTLLRLTGSSNVEDLAQEVFLRLYRALPGFRSQAQLSTYLYRIAYNVAQDEWKRRRRERELIASPALSDDEPDDSRWIESLPADAPSAEASLVSAELAQIVDEELLQLSAHERTALVLYHQEDQSYDQIAATLALPINTVRTHLHRGRERLGRAVRSRLAATVTLSGGTA